MCPECGKKFVPAPMHVYHNELDDIVCSYTCMLKAERRAQAKIEEKAERRRQINKERSEVIKEAKKFGFKNPKGHITAKVAREAKEFMDEIRRKENESKILSEDTTGRSNESLPRLSI